MSYLDEQPTKIDTAAIRESLVTIDGVTAYDIHDLCDEVDRLRALLIAVDAECAQAEIDEGETVGVHLRDRLRLLGFQPHAGCRVCGGSTIVASVDFGVSFARGYVSLASLSQDGAVWCIDADQSLTDIDDCEALGQCFDWSVLR